MPGTGLPRSSTQCGKAAETLHVLGFLVLDSGGPGKKVTDSPLQLVWGARASGADHQALPDGTMRPEYADEVAETGCVDSQKVHKGDLHSNRGGWSGVF